MVGYEELKDDWLERSVVHDCDDDDQCRFPVPLPREP